jgi:hypothetical protein
LGALSSFFFFLASFHIGRRGVVEGRRNKRSRPVLGFLVPLLFSMLGLFLIEKENKKTEHGGVDTSEQQCNSRGRVETARWNFLFIL